MAGYQTQIVADGHTVMSLADILPVAGKLRMLIVAKKPAPVSVDAGHYFQGKQGIMFWNRLTEYGLLRVPLGKYQDEVLIEHGYGLTDVVRVPRAYGSEPSEQEYRQGIARIRQLISAFNPTIVMFVYKGVLDNILHLGFGIGDKSTYGFNPSYDALLGAKVFVFPMPGTPCTKLQAQESMRALAAALAAG